MGRQNGSHTDTKCIWNSRIVEIIRNHPGSNAVQPMSVPSTELYQNSSMHSHAPFLCPYPFLNRFMIHRRPWTVPNSCRMCMACLANTTALMCSPGLDGNKRESLTDYRGACLDHRCTARISITASMFSGMPGVCILAQQHYSGLCTAPAMLSINTRECIVAPYAALGA